MAKKEDKIFYRKLIIIGICLFYFMVLAGAMVKWESDAFQFGVLMGVISTAIFLILMECAIDEKYWK